MQGKKTFTVSGAKSMNESMGVIGLGRNCLWSELKRFFFSSMGAKRHQFRSEGKNQTKFTICFARVKLECLYHEGSVNIFLVITSQTKTTHFNDAIFRLVVVKCSLVCFLYLSNFRNLYCAF